MDMETITMQLIVSSGDAKSKAMEAISCAKSGDFAEAKKHLEEAGDFLSAAHRFQTDIIQEEADGNIEKVSVLMAHAQDHLMNAITIIDMSREFVDLYEKINKK
nr:PTS lactose/cellobiose transporter subunit IIA [uncultured Caproiciproducens sp.]